MWEFLGQLYRMISSLHSCYVNFNFDALSVATLENNTNNQMIDMLNDNSSFAFLRFDNIHRSFDGSMILKWTVWNVSLSRIDYSIEKSFQL